MPRRPCNHAGCRELLSPPATRCDKHQKAMSKQVDSTRKNAHQRGYSRQWRKARLGFLSKHPLCEHCRKDGLTEEATVVDHIEPHRGDKDLFWQRANWQPLCKRCHDRKTATEDGGFTGY